MGDYNDKNLCFYQNLIDAGCNEKVAKKCLELKKNNEKAHLDMILVRHRADLLEQLHRIQSEIDCLDYLKIKLKKEEQM